MKFYVVVGVPDMDDPREAPGNLATVAPDLYRSDGIRVHIMQQMMMMKPVFHIGEILVVDGDGREVAGLGRKPAKWDVEIESFDNVEDAAARAREVVDLTYTY